MFSRKPRLPIDIILETEGDHPRGNHKDHLSSWKREMEDAFQSAFAKSSERKEKDTKRKLQTGPCLGVLEPGDRVLFKNLTPRGDPEKLTLFWEQGIAEIVKRHENDVTYSVKSIAEPGKIRTLHRNMLMAIKHVTDSVDQTPQISPMKTKRD